MGQISSYTLAEFLYIVPLKQGLKPNFSSRVGASGTPFLYIVPLKQGLKLASSALLWLNKSRFYT